MPRKPLFIQTFTDTKNIYKYIIIATSLNSNLYPVQQTKCTAKNVTTMPSDGVVTRIIYMLMKTISSGILIKKILSCDGNLRSIWNVELMGSHVLF